MEMFQTIKHDHNMFKFIIRYETFSQNMKYIYFNIPNVKNKKLYDFFLNGISKGWI